MRSFDVVIVGGGSGGVACARSLVSSLTSRGPSLLPSQRRSRFPKIAIVDSVRDSTQGTSWGFGGTCVNVGCIPKKLFKHASGLGPGLGSEAFGWKKGGKEKEVVDWEVLREVVQGHVKMLNFKYLAGLNPAPAPSPPREDLPKTLFGEKVDLKSGRLGGGLPFLLGGQDDEEIVSYVHGQARFESPNELSIWDPNARINSEASPREVIRAEKIVIAVGGRPFMPSQSELPGALEFGISSDDIFTLSRPPGKSLVVGASYVALECASFLQGLGFNTTLLIRSKPLKGDAFDVECAEKLVSLLSAVGVKVIRDTVPTKLEKNIEDKKIMVTFKTGAKEIFDTVLFGTGRAPEVKNLTLNKAFQSLPISQSSGKIKVMSSTDFRVRGSDHIFAIGDCADTGMPELTPVAIRQGETLGSELFASENDKPNSSAVSSSFMIPSTVFTIPEYARIGISEAAAIRIYGAENIETYLMDFSSLEMSASHVLSDVLSAGEGNCFVKLICNKKENNKVLGVHLVMPHAGEALQGLALAVRLGCTKQDFDNDMLGIHPIDSEALFSRQMVSRSSGKDWRMGEGCGGGRCG